MTTGAGTGTASSRREKEDTRHSVAEYYDMIEKEYSAAPPPAFGPLAKWPAPWFNAGTQRTTQTDQQKKRCIA